MAKIFFLALIFLKNSEFGQGHKLTKHLTVNSFFIKSHHVNLERNECIIGFQLVIETLFYIVL